MSDPSHSLTHRVQGGMDRVRAVVSLRNQHPVPPGVHHDVDQPVPVTVTLRWATGDEQLDTIALEWWRSGFMSDGDDLNRSHRHHHGGDAHDDLEGVRTDSNRPDSPTSLVRVRITDPRCMTGAVWVPAEDVRRR